MLASFAYLLTLSHLVQVDPSIAETNPANRGTKVVFLDDETNPRLDWVEFRLGKDRTLTSSLKELNVGARQTREILEGFRPKQDRLIRLPKGARLLASVTPGPQREVQEVKLEIAPEYVLHLQRAVSGDRRFELSEVEENYTIKMVTFTNTVKTTMWESASEAKMDSQLVGELADIFRWQVDFAREVRKGDRWRIAVEERYLQGKRVGWGRILAAEFECDGDSYAAILYRRDWNEVGYFSPEGSSLKRIFLKSPIQYRRISSRFTGDRLHPILKKHRPHMGVDYSAWPGTPVHAVGDGEIIQAKFSVSGGNTIKIKHNGPYMTAYKHLKAFAPQIAVGSRVKQGELIGYVGSTGLATGAHLHFEFYDHGKYVDPLGKKWPSADPVTERDMPVFPKFAYAAIRTLPPWVNPPTAALSRADRAPAGFAPPQPALTGALKP